MRWQKDDLDNNLNFFSVSSDGRVVSWTLVKVGARNKCWMLRCTGLLLYQSDFDLCWHLTRMSCIITMWSTWKWQILPMKDLMEQNYQPLVRVPLWFLWLSDLYLSLRTWQHMFVTCVKPWWLFFLLFTGAGTTFDFHHTKPYLFLVGTEEGLVYRCSTSYTNTYLTTCQAHHMAVYRTQWNPYHEDIFITCSADWTVKIWDQKHGLRSEWEASQCLDSLQKRLSYLIINPYPWDQFVPAVLCSTHLWECSGFVLPCLPAWTLTDPYDAYASLLYLSIMTFNLWYGQFFFLGKYIFDSFASNGGNISDICLQNFMVASYSPLAPEPWLMSNMANIWCNMLIPGQHSSRPMLHNWGRVP